MTTLQASAQKQLRQLIEQIERLEAAGVGVRAQRQRGLGPRRGRTAAAVQPLLWLALLAAAPAAYSAASMTWRSGISSIMPSACM